MTLTFDHEKLRAYQHAIAFIVWCEQIFKMAPKKIAVYDQLDRASTSIALNIAEGDGKFSNKDRCRFLDIARSSALESAACLDVLLAKGHFKEQELREGKLQLQAIVSMLMGLIANFSKHISDETEPYGLIDDSE